MESMKSLLVQLPIFRLTLLKKDSSRGVCCEFLNTFSEYLFGEKQEFYMCSRSGEKHLKKQHLDVSYKNISFHCLKADKIQTFSPKLCPECFSVTFTKFRGSRSEMFL